MAKNRMVTKHCPKCEQQVPVACKSCPCGHEFFANRRSQSRSASEAAGGVRRRTERVRKERQSYLAALVLEERARAAAKVKRNKRGRPRNSSSHDDSSEERQQQGKAKLRAKAQVKVELEPEMPDEEEEDVFAGASKEKLEQYAVILADINRKLNSQLFQQQFLL